MRVVDVFKSAEGRRPGVTGGNQSAGRSRLLDYSKIAMEPVKHRTLASGTAAGSYSGPSIVLTCTSLATPSWSWDNPSAEQSTATHPFLARPPDRRNVTHWCSASPLGHGRLLRPSGVDRSELTTRRQARPNSRPIVAATGDRSLANGQDPRRLSPHRRGDPIGSRCGKPTLPLAHVALVGLGRSVELAVSDCPRAGCRRGVCAEPQRIDPFADLVADQPYRRSPLDEARRTTTTSGLGDWLLDRMILFVGYHSPILCRIPAGNAAKPACVIGGQLRVNYITLHRQMS
jgi:hypothetical protein